MPELSTGKTNIRYDVINDCWNKIGVRGDVTCPELKRHAHCRNCPTYSAAASRLLDGDLPDNYVREWTAHFAQNKVAEEGDTHTCIIFRIGSEWFALPTSVIDEVTQERTIHSLPHQRNRAVLGLVNVRGELLICISLAKMLGLEESTSRKTASVGHQRLIVVRHDGGGIAFPVEEVQRTHRYHSRELKIAPATIIKSAAAYTKALLRLQDRTVGYLDEKLIIRALKRSVA
jgi:chemotaxis-related protein WspD